MASSSNNNSLLRNSQAVLSIQQSRHELSLSSSGTPPASPGKQSLIVVELVTKLMQRVFHDTKPYLLKEKVSSDQSKEEYIRNHFVSELSVSKKNKRLADLVRQVCQYIVQQFETEDTTHLIKEITQSKHLCVLKDSLQQIRETYQQLQEGFKEGKLSLQPAEAVLSEGSFTEGAVNIFVTTFNKNDLKREEFVEEAVKLLYKIKKLGWNYEDGIKTVPKAESVTTVRNMFFKMYRCNDARIKMMALNYLIEIMECDPLAENAAYDLVGLQERLLWEIKASNVQKLTTSIQRLLAKAYSITLECTLIHASRKHLTATTTSHKDEVWSGADELEGMNKDGDEEISFWTAYAVQGAQHLETDKNEIIEWIERLALIVEAGVRIASAINRPEEGGAALADAYENIYQAFWHVRWRKDWFKQVLVLKKLCRNSINNVETFRLVVDIIQKKKREESGHKLFYGVVSILEYVISKTTKSEIQEEGLKLLLQYLSVDDSKVKNRVIAAFVQLLKLDEREGRLQYTVYCILKLMQASEDISASSVQSLITTLPASVKRSLNSHRQRFERSKGDLNKFMFVNVIKFMLRRMAEVKQEEDIGGHSFVTLLSSSNEDRVVPALLKALKKISKHFLEPDIYGQTPYHISAIRNNPSMIRYLQESMSEININFRDYQKRDTALHFATCGDKPEIVTELLKAGASPDIKNAKGNTPLHLATSLRNATVAVRLLEAGANPSLVNNKGKAPLNIALEDDCVAFTSLLTHYKGQIAEHVHQCTPTIIAAQKSSEKVLMDLIKKGKGRLNRLEGLEILRMITRNRQGMTCTQEFAKFHYDMMTSNRYYPRAFKPYCPWPKMGLNDQGEAVLLGSNPKTRCEAFGNTRLIQLARDPKRISAFVKRAKRKKSELNQANYLKVTPLHTAVACRNYEATIYLLDAGVGKNVIDARGYTPLHLAAYMGDLKMVKILLKEEVDPNIPNDYGDTPLLIFAGKVPGRSPTTIESILPKLEVTPMKNDAIGKVLINSGAKPNEQDVQGNTALHHALNHGHSIAIQFFFRAFPDLFWQKSSQGFIPIQEAALKKKSKAIRAMLDVLSNKQLVEYSDQFAKVEGITDTLGNILAKLGDTETFERLLKKKRHVAYQQDTSKVGETPLHVSAGRGQVKILEVYKKHHLELDHRDGFGNTSAHVAALRGYTEFFISLSKEDGFDLSVKNDDQRTPLHLAAANGHREIIDWILNKFPGLALEREGQHGDTPLHIACRYGHIEILDSLYKRNPKVIHAVNDDGDTPLHVAATHGSESASLFLMKKGANLEARNLSGKTPFLLAAQEGYSTVSNILYNKGKGADFWAQDDEKESSLHKAVFKLHLDVIRFLLSIDKLGQLVKKQDVRCEIPLHEIAKIHLTKSGQANVRREVLQLLMDAGSNPTHVNDQGETFLHPICSYGAQGLLELLHRWSVANKIKIDFAVKDNRGNTILHKACGQNQRHMVETIVEMFVGINAKNDQGQTALHVAVANGFIPLARQLVALGAKVTSRDKEGKTVLHYLLRHENFTQEMRDFLTDLVVRKPRLIMIVDENKESCVHTVARNNHPDAINILLRNLDGKQKHLKDFVWKENNEGKSAYNVAKESGNQNMRRRIQNYDLNALGADVRARKGSATSSSN